MPKTEAEARTLATFISEYGEERGKKIYYSKRNKSPSFDQSQGGGFSSKKAKAEWWHARLEKLPAHIKSKVIGLVEVDQDVDWWMKRIKPINLNKAKRAKEYHTRLPPQNMNS